MFEGFYKQKRYLKFTILFVLAFILVMNLVISGRNKKATDDQDHSRRERYGERNMIQRMNSSQTIRKSGNKLKMKTFIENCPNYNYKMEDIPSCPETMKRRFPTALIAGVSKGGTTMLLKFLNAHPRIAARDGKLPQNVYTAFFAKRKKTDEWYRNLMPCSYANQITMERSPAYFNCKSCSDAIFKFNSKMKLIFIFRDPTNRAFSHYLMEKRTSKLGNKTFEDIVLAANRTRVKDTSFYIFVSRYQEHIQKWLGKFSLDQMLFLDSNTFTSSPSDVLNRVEDFLGIERFFTKDMFKSGDRGKYCLVMDEGNLVCPPHSKSLSHPNMKETTRRTLNTYFKHKNRKFFQLINKQFEWEY